MKKDDKKWIKVTVVVMVLTTLVIIYLKPSGLPLVGCYSAIGLSVIGAVLLFIADFAEKSK